MDSCAKDQLTGEPLGGMTTGKGRKVDGLVRECGVIYSAFNHKRAPFCWTFRRARVYAHPGNSLRPGLKNTCPTYAPFNHSKTVGFTMV